MSRKWSATILSFLLLLSNASGAFAVDLETIKKSESISYELNLTICRAGTVANFNNRCEYEDGDTQLDYEFKLVGNAKQLAEGKKCFDASLKYSFDKEKLKTLLGRNLALKEDSIYKQKALTLGIWTKQRQSIAGESSVDSLKLQSENSTTVFWKNVCLTLANSNLGEEGLYDQKNLLLTVNLPLNIPIYIDGKYVGGISTARDDEINLGEFPSSLVLPKKTESKQIPVTKKSKKSGASKKIQQGATCSKLGSIEAIKGKQFICASVAKNKIWLVLNINAPKSDATDNDKSNENKVSSNCEGRGGEIYASEKLRYGRSGLFQYYVTNASECNLQVLLSGILNCRAPGLVYQVAASKEFALAPSSTKTFDINFDFQASQLDCNIKMGGKGGSLYYQDSSPGISPQIQSTSP